MSNLTRTEARQILGVSNFITMAGLKNAYYQFCSRYHPDKGGDADVFKKGKEAYEYLKIHIKHKGIKLYESVQNFA